MAKKILVVDDEAVILTVIQSRLEANGYEVITASDGQQGLSKARSEKPDLIILDLMLPKLDGARLCRLLKFDDNYKHIPILVLTARVRKESFQKGLDAGADAFVTKPFVPETLLDNIKQLLNKAPSGEKSAGD